MKKIMVTGSRDWTDERTIHYAIMEEYASLGCYESTILITGACPTGADRIAEVFWSHANLPILRVPARWDRHGKSAGPVRNKIMVDYSPDVVLAFPLGDSRGTRGAIKLAQDADLLIRVFEG